MAKARMKAKLAAGCLLLWGGASVWAAPPSAADMLRFRPKQDAVVCSTPSAQEQEACKVEPVQMQGKIVGWMLKDGKGQVLRRFYASNGANLDLWAYYLNGNEVYRELDSNRNGKADNYRWLSAGGMKWGIDVNEDGKIDSWKMISAEEVSQEVLIAVVKRDYSRLQALMITEDEMKALALPAAEMNRIRDVQKKAPAKFQETCSKLASLGDKVRWIHLETAAPQCIPAEVAGTKQDVLKYAQGSITFINEATSKPEGLQMGEIIQVGMNWRIVDAPIPDSGESPVGGTGSADMGAGISKEMQPVLEKLRKHDETARPDAAPTELARHNLKRADILEEIAALAKPEERDQWLRQVADSLSSAVQNNPADKAPYQRLVGLRDRMLKEQPTSPVTSHVLFYEMSADYAAKLTGPEGQKDFAKLQKDWLEKLGKFVQDYPKSEDTPDALMQLGMVSELVGEEDKAKNWYALLAKDFPSHPQTPKAVGAKARLELDGKELALSGATLSGSPFDLKSVKSKVVVVYYWASWNQQCAGDFAKLKEMKEKFGSKGLEVVGVNLDDTPAQAKEFLAKNPMPGAQLHEPGGMGSKLANDYGIMVLPTMFMVKEGKVSSRTLQITTLEDELKKALN